MSKVVYRAVKSNDSDEVIVIGCDENQGGKDYNGIGTWCNFTFNKIPNITPEINELIKDKSHISLVKVKDESIVLKTVEEIQADLEKVEARSKARANNNLSNNITK